MFQKQQPKKRLSLASLPLNRTTNGSTTPASMHPALSTIPNNICTTHSNAKIDSILLMHETVEGLHTLCDAIDEVKEFISDPNASQTK